MWWMAVMVIVGRGGQQEKWLSEVGVIETVVVHMKFSHIGQQTEECSSFTKGIRKSSFCMCFPTSYNYCFPPVHCECHPVFVSSWLVAIHSYKEMQRQLSK